MEDDDDYPIINMPEEEEEEVEEEVEPEPEPQEFFKKPEMSLKEKRLENLRKAREARKKKKESKPKPKPEPKTEPIIQQQNFNLDYDKLINSIVDKLEDNKAKRKATKKVNNEPTQIQKQEPNNIYDSLF